MSWWPIARAQAGAISYRQLCGAGLSADQVDRMSRRGELDRLCRSVYLAAGAPHTYQARLWAAHLATDGDLAFETAGRLWGVYEDVDEDDVHVVVPHGRRIVAPPGVRVHRCRVPRSAIRLRGGLPITDRTWTLLDLLATLRWTHASRLADRALQRRWLEHDDLARRLAAHPRRPGNAQLRRLAGQVTDGAAAHSERVLHRLLRTAGIFGWVPNHEVWAGGELVGVVDVAIPARRIAIEVDGMAYHVDVDRFRADRRKQNGLVALGWTVLRFTWADLTERPGYVIATIRRLAA